MHVFAICVYDLAGLRCKQATMRERERERGLFGWSDKTNVAFKCWNQYPV